MSLVNALGALESPKGRHWKAQVVPFHMKARNGRCSWQTGTVWYTSARSIEAIKQFGVMAARMSGKVSIRKLDLCTERFSPLKSCIILSRPSFFGTEKIGEISLALSA